MKRYLGVAFLALLSALFPSPASAEPAKTPIVATDPLKFEMERHLYRLKIPTGKVDGVIDAKTRRAICIWRELTDRKVTRALPTNSDITAIAATETLTPTKKLIQGMNINLTCQSAIWLRDAAEKSFFIFRVSTGRKDFETLPGKFKITWLIDDWYESHAYPNGWMYRPQFFNRGQALHGSRTDSVVHPYPASHGCVRMIKADVDYLWENGFGKGSLVFVYGKWVW